MVKIFVSSIIEAPTVEVWEIVRDFNDMPNWHPAIARSMIEGGRLSDAIGCVRNFYLQDGTQIREQLLMLSDFDYQFSYAVLESELDVKNYIARLKFIPVTDKNHTFGEWTAEFNTTSGKEAEMAGMISQNVFQAGFDALKKRFSGENQ
ncbi:SRPBCC family protein [Candidatus Spongiihabitans sp.]|uniref:SRPBCC family protein n=1 Tax=Candidatus Spongiihabitans sp. TaxID=3101308 RepID=UPI003C702413